MTPLARVRTRSHRIYYGWWISFTGGLNMTISSLLTFQAASVLFKAIEVEYGWSRAAIAGVATFGRFGGALFGPLEGWLTDRFGSAKMVLYGFLLGGIGLISVSLIQNIPTYYLAYFVMSLGFSIGGFTPSMTAVNAWMPHRRPTAMSIVLAGSSVGGFLVVVIVWGFDEFGWRKTIFALGLVTIAMGPVLAKMMARKLPDPKAMDRLVRATGRKRRKPGQKGGLGHDFTAGEALRTRGFWSVALTHMLVNLSVGAMSAHLFLHLTDDNGVGLGDAAAGTIIVIYTVAAFTFQLLGGYAGERFEKRRLITGLALIQGGSLVLLAFAGNYWQAVVFAVLWGLGFSGRTPVLHSMRGDFFGRKHYGTILGLSALPMAIGMMISPWAVGFIFDIQGTYDNALFFMAGACVVASIVIQFATRPSPPTPKSANAGLSSSTIATKS